MVYFESYFPLKFLFWGYKLLIYSLAIALVFKQSLFWPGKENRYLLEPVTAGLKFLSNFINFLEVINMFYN